MDKPKQPDNAPQIDQELDKYRKYTPFVLGTFPPSEYRAILRYIWRNPPSWPPSSEPSEK